MRRRAPENLPKSLDHNAESEGLECLVIRDKKLSALITGTAAVAMRLLHMQKEYIIVRSGGELSRANMDR
jgi:hypothetical protein